MNLLKPFRNQRGDGTTVMFTTLNMVLLAFFIVLNSIAVESDDNKKKALGSLLGSFGMLPGGLAPTKTENGKLSIPPGPEMVNRDYRIAEFLKEMETFALEEGAGDGVIMFHSKHGMRVLLASDIAFAKGQSTLQPKAVEVLRKLSQFAKGVEGDFQLIGHVAEGNHRYGIYPNEWKLSIAMAGTAAQYLKKIGVRAKRLSAAGYGRLKPMLSDGSKLDNRFAGRLEIIFERKVPL